MLKHIGAPSDPNGIHFDLLLEDFECCRSWRLTEIPQINGNYVEAFSISPHNLEWLDIEQKFVSGNRGFARRIKHGIFFGSLPRNENIALNLLLIWDDMNLSLDIDKNGCRVRNPKK